MKRIILMVIVAISLTSCKWFRDTDIEERNGVIYMVDESKTIFDKRRFCYVQFEEKRVGMYCDSSIEVGDSVKISFIHYKKVK